MSHTEDASDHQHYANSDAGSSPEVSPSKFLQKGPKTEADYEAFMQLFVSHESRLRGFIRSLLPNWNDVDDVIQEACR